MLKELEGYDWEEAFKYADFGREDVEKIYGIVEGENDAESWIVWGKLKNGKYFVLDAWCDYTGWGCQEGGNSFVADTKKELITNHMTEEQRIRFKLREVPEEIKIKPPPKSINKSNNINDICTVKLTPEGLRILEREAAYMLKSSYFNKEDNTLSVELWVVIQIFGGSTMYMGGPQYFVDNEIIFKE